MKLKKKGFIRILEAGIAAILLLGFISLVTLPNYVRQTNLEDEVYKAVNLALDDIERDDRPPPEGLRRAVLDQNHERIDQFLEEELGKKQIVALSAMCDLAPGGYAPCFTPPDIPTDKDVFVRERIITDGAGNVKRLTIHAWTKF